MRIVHNAYEHNSGVDKFAAGVLFQKYTDDPGKRAVAKNIGYNAARYLSVLTIAPMAIAAIKKHSHKRLQGLDSQISLEIKGKVITFSHVSDRSNQRHKYCLLFDPTHHLQYQEGAKTVSKIRSIVNNGETLYLGKLQSADDVSGYFKLYDDNHSPIENPCPYKNFGPHGFALDLSLIYKVEG